MKHVSLGAAAAARAAMSACMGDFIIVVVVVVREYQTVMVISNRTGQWRCDQFGWWWEEEGEGGLYMLHFDLNDCPQHEAGLPHRTADNR